EPLLDLARHGFDGGSGGDVGTESRGTPTALAYGFRDPFRLGITRAIVHRDRSSGLGQRQCDRPADAARAAGDQCHAVFEIIQSQHPYLLVKKHGLCLSLLETEVDGPAHADRAMYDPGRNGGSLERPDANGAAILHLDDDRSFQDDEELIGRRVHMPAVLPLENGQPQAAVVDPVEYLIPILLRHGPGLSREVDDP